MTPSNDRDSARARQALLLGLIGVVIFGLTLPATRVAVQELDPVFVACGRSVLAAVLAAGTLRGRGRSRRGDGNGRGSPCSRPARSWRFRC